jgi:hypothetical protein
MALAMAIAGKICPPVPPPATIMRRGAPALKKCFVYLYLFLYQSLIVRSSILYDFSD